MILRNTDQKSSIPDRFSENPNDPTLTQITRAVSFNEHEDTAWTVTWGIRYMVVDRRRGKISACALFRTDSESQEPDVIGLVETGGTWSTRERDKLASALMESLNRGHYYPRPHVIDMLEDIGRDLLESVVV